MSVDLRPCPFCGDDAEVEQAGTGRRSCIVVCTGCGARHESGDTWNSGASWNERATPTTADLLSDPRVAAVVRALRRSDPTSGALHDEKAEALAQFGLGGGE